MRTSSLAKAILFGLLVLACDDQKNAGKPPQKAIAPIAEAEPVAAEAKPKSPPNLSIDESGMSVNFAMVGPQGDLAAQLEKKLREHEEFISGKDLTLRIARKAKPAQVRLYLSILDKLGAGNIAVETQISRPAFNKPVVLELESKAKNADRCSTVVSIREDNSTATWKLSGGTAISKKRGLGGPDLSTTGIVLEQYRKSCQSPYLFLSADDSIEWGLLADLAASSLVLSEHRYERLVLITGTATAGREISFK